MGIKLKKNVTDTYCGANNTTFQRTFSKWRWGNNSTPDSIYGDEFAYSKILREYQKTTAQSYYTPAGYEMKTSGGETSKTTLRDQYGNTIATARTTTPVKQEQVKTADAKTETQYFVYNVTVTRNWYTRTYYYKDRAPTSEMVYQDTEKAVGVRTYTETN